MEKLPKLSGLDPRAILVRGVNWLGDAVMTTPALQRLREHFPDATLILLTPKKLADLWLYHPAVDDVITFKPQESVLRVAAKIRGWKFTNTIATSFDLALILPNSPRSALETWLARIPRRSGYARPWRNWFLTDSLPARAGHVQMRKRSASEIKRLISAPHSTLHTPRSTSHQIHDYLHLTAALGAIPDPLPPRVEVLAAEVTAAESSLLSEVRTKWNDSHCGTSPFWFALNPSAAYGPAKRWPADRFAAVARQVCGRFPNAIWIAVGGPDDFKLCNEIIQTANVRMINRAGNTSLRDLMALLKLARVLLTNDSGPMHVAAALGTPVVVPFGSTSPDLTAPGLPGDPKHRLLSANAPCSPCFLRQCPIDFRCLTGISVETVTESVLRVIG